MKRIISILLTIIMMFSCISAYAASTAESVYNESKSNEKDQYFTTSGKIENGGSEFVTLLVTTDGSISVDSIMYIDQTVANADGTFSFTDYIPKINVPYGERYVVKVGASSLSQTIPGGYLEVPEPQGYTVSGKVNCYGEKTTAKLKLKKDGAVVATADATAQGTFNFENIPDGEYYMIVTKNAHLPAVVSVIVNNGNISVPEITLLPGDCVAEGMNQTREIGYTDLSLVIDIYGATTEDLDYKAEYDVNEDGEIGYTELSEIINNYGKEVDARYDE